MRASSQFVVSCLNVIKTRPGAQALDAPCGFGRHTVELRDRGYVVTALDIDQRRIGLVATQLRQYNENGSAAEVGDLERPDTLSVGAFEVALVVDYVSEIGLRTVLASVRAGGFIVIETFRAYGENWRQLPSPGRFYVLLSDQFDVLRYEERAAGKTRSEAVSVRCLGRRYA